MKTFNLHTKVLDQYKEYLMSFIQIKDERIKAKVTDAIEGDDFLPEPLIQFNPSYKVEISLENFIKENNLHLDLGKIFKGYNLYKHQTEAIQLGTQGKGFVVTSGTGSGKSLTFLATIFNYILKKNDKKPGVKAIIVYPMNALINSQEEEIKKFAENYGDDFPITFAKYTGQEGTEAREKIKEENPDIILTNYMMLELIMTRQSEEWMRKSLKNNLKFLVFDELHTYRGRQGADVSMLIRRIRQQVLHPIITIGTSATMSTEEGDIERKIEVAKVAKTIFGDIYNTDQIIEETLERCTYQNNPPPQSELIEAIKNPIYSHTDANKFVVHPLAIWLENRIAVSLNGNGNLERGKPISLEGIVNILVEDSGLEFTECKSALLSLFDWSEKLNIDAVNRKTRKSFLPFKLHQFISQTSTVFVSLEEKSKRKISIETGRYIKDSEDRDMLIYPVLFSRYSGHEFICVTLDFDKKQLEPRETDDLPHQWTQTEIKGDRNTGRKKRKMEQEDFPGGYLIIQDEDEEDIWDEEQVRELPSSWWKDIGGQAVPTNFYEHQLPRKIWFNSSGQFSNSWEDNKPMWAWYIPAKLLIDPTAGLIYDRKTSENTKLMRLGNEGRSTATTLTSYAVVSEMHQQGEPIQDQKLLSFTDNRQDASLQAGHFNDFISTGHLRSALYKALKVAPGNQLKAYEIAPRVSDVLNLEEKEYISDDKITDYPDSENRRALETYLLTRILYDLRRGWRYNLPNLEQAGLLKVEYQNLESICEKDESLNSLLIFEKLEWNERYKMMMQILNFFRTTYALDYPVIDRDRAMSENFMKERLDPSKPWGPDQGEKIEIPYSMVPTNPGKTAKYLYTASIGPTSYLGKYIKRKYRDLYDDHLTNQEYLDFIELICERLRNFNLLVRQEIRGSNLAVNGYRLRVDQVIWKLGDGETVMPDEVRVSSYKGLDPKPNKYFKKFYEQDFSAFGKSLIGSEHTGQIGNEDRIKRENEFRKGIISALFCSPTMELGIDIANLNIVHMRNVPPTPANYAQRGGRAGRSGQTALIFTYCSQWSPHDRNYFKKPDTMVSGTVVPPRIDLVNEELILTHYNAFVLMKCETEMRVSVDEVIDIGMMPELPLRQRIKDNLTQNMNDFGASWAKEFGQLIQDRLPEVESSTWFNEAWLNTHQKSFVKRFDRAFDRWRILFKAADELLAKAQAILKDPTIRDFKTRIQAKINVSIALSQRDLLLNQSKHTFGNHSEFYIFRYLASEGFLPGYNFTRLPVRTFVGMRSTQQGEYISRPRFIGLREFGPNSLVYHNGQKFRINRLLLADASVKTHKVKSSTETAYALMGDQADAHTNDPITGKELSGSRVNTVTNVIELSESEAIPQNRISCEEEERMKTGFTISQYFNYPKGMDANREAMIKSGGQQLLRLIYGPSSNLIQVNEGWKRSPDSDGFYIDDRNGRWLKQAALEDEETKKHAHQVKIFATDTADTLYIQPVKDLGASPDQVYSLAYALKRGIESLFQVEESEIGVWVLGNPESPNILLFEAAEGSLGILSQLVDEPKKLRQLFKESYILLHFDPETRTDLRPDLPKATYDDLLSYYNQMFHAKMNRHDVQKIFERLMDCEVEPKKEGRDREEQYKYLLSVCDPKSSTERPFVEFLYKEGYVLPDKAQVNIPECYVNVDFVFNTNTGPVLVFCDGSVHDDEFVAKGDVAKRRCLRDAGYDIIEWYYKTPIEELIESRKDIFRKIT